MPVLRSLLLALSLFSAATAQADQITVAAAADLKFALNDIVARFERAHPGDDVQVVYGSSGKFNAQIRQGAPYDLYFSADIAFPRELARSGLAASDVMPYAMGRIVLWMPGLDARHMTLASLTAPGIKRIAMANPRHAPYGKRAEEALRAAGVWGQVKHKLVFGENIAHAAQFVQTGNAQAGIIALALARNPELARQGSYWLIPDTLHKPLEQGFIITKRAEGNALAQRFADYMSSPVARTIMTGYGFVLPGDAVAE
jgi:molybdate transport system substrate-binding protein